MYFCSVVVDVYITLHLHVSDGGSMYTFGETEDGKLGHGDTTIDNTEPTHVDVDNVMVSVSCGGSHTVALSGKMSKY